MLLGHLRELSLDTRDEDAQTRSPDVGRFKLKKVGHGRLSTRIERAIIALFLEHRACRVLESGDRCAPAIRARNYQTLMTNISQHRDTLPGVPSLVISRPSAISDQLR